MQRRVEVPGAHPIGNDGIDLDVLRFDGEIRSLRRERAELEARRADARPAGFTPSLTRSAWIVRLGDLPPRLIPWLLALTWMVLLAKVLTGGA